MKDLILSDIHANLEALEAVLTEAPREDYDQLLVLGDLVGYGASPNEVVDRVFALGPDVLIRGNHDKVASGVEEPDAFNEVAATAARWTLETLTDANRARIAELPSGPAFAGDEIEICHGTPFDEDVYVFDQSDAMRALSAAQRRVCFFGHTHLPVVFELSPPSTLQVVVPDLGDADPTVVPLDDERRYLINPGSVGQPRDGDPRASYGVFDTVSHTVVLHRVPYRVDLAQEKIVAAGLPTPLARRLGVGR
jgi:diadenosine tetraphosphatase ApaH/serine/threonine PP2A family protein phosphatase